MQRLRKVTFKDSSSTATKIVEYTYDHSQRWIRKTLDTNADGTIESSNVFVHDAGQIVLDFAKAGTGDAAGADLDHRYLWGPSVDQILAEETYDGTQTADDVLWPLTDHQKTVRDLASYNPTTDATTIANHLTYDAFGNVLAEADTSVDSLFLYTARPYDADTALQNNLNRWYDLSTGRWMSEDPIGFAGGDGNLYRYVGNSLAGKVDPSGLIDVFTEYYDISGPYHQLELQPRSPVVSAGRWALTQFDEPRIKIDDVAHLRITRIVFPMRVYLYSATVWIDVEFLVGNANVTLPHWTDRSTGRPDQQAAWDKFVAALDLHEAKHVDIYSRFASSWTFFGRSLGCPSPDVARAEAEADLARKIDEFFNERVRQLNRAQSDFLMGDVPLVVKTDVGLQESYATTISC